MRWHSTAVGLCLLLTACGDTRREAVRGWLQAHPPEGFEVASIPERIFITDAAGGDSETMVPMRYRLTHPTVRVHDASDLPRGQGIAKRIAAVRGWAIASLPGGDPTREVIAATSAKARAAFPIKRVVIPQGTEVESLVILVLHKEQDGWKIVPEPFAVDVPGAKDEDLRIPLENSPEVAAKFDELEAVARSLEDTRHKYLVERQRAADASLATLRSRLRTGNAFEGRLADEAPVRLIVARGADGDAPAVVVLTVERTVQSSARYTGGIVQQPSGEHIWRAAQVVSLGSPGMDASTAAAGHPILTLAAEGKGLSAQIQSVSRRPISFVLSPVGTRDILPENLW